MDPQPLSVSSETEDQPDGGAFVSSIQVPIAVETKYDVQTRDDLAKKYGLMPDQVPKARRSDTDLEVDFTISNNSDSDGIAWVAMEGANEFFRYDPTKFVVEIPGDDDENPPPPPLAASPKQIIPAHTQVNGTFTESDMSEAAQDLDAITRALIQPDFALITRWPTLDVTGGMAPFATIPAAVIPLILEIDLTLISDDTPMSLSWKLRIRDRSTRLRPEETDKAKLIAPSTTVFVPAAATTPDAGM